MRVGRVLKAPCYGDCGELTTRGIVGGFTTTYHDPDVPDESHHRDFPLCSDCEADLKGLLRGEATEVST